ncbi:MAG TPA: hypothetical protein VHT96_00635, partial [Clostridia bacterium]|nr:hypothetical protein [Clostridia bacterium]
KYHVNLFNQKNNVTNSFATLLAMKSLELIIPKFKAVNAETILEARYKLRDLLPPFWSSMIKLTTDLKARIKENIPSNDLIMEGKEIIESTVKPALIDLKQKMALERKHWFYKIIGPVNNGIKLLAGNSSLSQSNLMLTGLSLGTNMAFDVADQIRKVDLLSKETGLMFLLKLDKIINSD